jgi:chemotaxis response regulator CheB
MKLPISVGIVDDHPGVRLGIRNLLVSAVDIVIVGEGENGADAIQLVEQEKPTVYKPLFTLCSATSSSALLVKYI